VIHLEAKYLGADTEARTYTFRASSAAVDRQNEVIDQAGWMLDAYKANPVILDSHKYGSIDDILGKAVRVQPSAEGLEVDVQFADTERGRMAQRLVDDGFLRTVSVGFRSMGRKPGQKAGESLTHTRMELLEVSMVAIPANRDAVRLRAVEEDEVSHEEKAGRRMSKASAEKVRGAIAMLMELLEDTEDAGIEGKPGHYGKPDEEPMKGLAIPDEVAAKLAAFAKEATNG
jgi:HK97 family phage prohead protease